MLQLLRTEKESLEEICGTFGTIVGSALEAINIAPWEIGLEKNLQTVCQKHTFTRSVFDIHEWQPPILDMMFDEKDFLIVHRNLYFLLETVFGSSRIGKPSLLKTAQNISIGKITPRENFSGGLTGVTVPFRLDFSNKPSRLFSILFSIDGSCRWTAQQPTAEEFTRSLTSVGSAAPSGRNSPTVDDLSLDDIDALYVSCPPELQSAWRALVNTLVLTSANISQMLTPLQHELITAFRQNTRKKALALFCHPENPSARRIEDMIKLVRQAIQQEYRILLNDRLTRKMKKSQLSTPLSSKPISPTLLIDGRALFQNSPPEIQSIWLSFHSNVPPTLDKIKASLLPHSKELITLCQTNPGHPKLIKLCSGLPSVDRLLVVLKEIPQAIYQDYHKDS